MRLRKGCASMKVYHHLKEKDRLRIYELLLEGHSIQAIAKGLGFHKSTLYRELNRNSSKLGYRPDFASHQYFMRRRKRKGKIEGNVSLAQTIKERLEEGWSPEQIAGRLKKEQQKHIISHESIYAYIYSPSQKALKLYKFLRKKKSFRYPRIRRKRHTNSAAKTSIHDRPSDINTRQAFGHWEGDLILFAKTRENLFTLRERKTRFLVGIKNATRHAHTTARTLINYMKEKNGVVDTLTLDNDTAFVEHPTIAQELVSQIYFCEPYKSWQKGGIENGNKLIREKLPLKTPIQEWDQKDVDKVISVLNERPMKCLGYKTPKEAFLHEVQQRGINLDEFALQP